MTEALSEWPDVREGVVSFVERRPPPFRRSPRGRSSPSQQAAGSGRRDRLELQARERSPEADALPGQQGELK
jgi:hypothetical protein